MQKQQVNFNSDPLISVIMNCYNGDKYLEKSINSLISQTYQNWELIFWDNNSQDESKNIFKKFQDKRLKYYHNNETTTLYKARNLAIEKSEGELLTFLDVDDYWSPKKLKFQVDFFLKFPDINFVYGNYYILNEKLKMKKIALKKKDLISGKIYNSLIEKYNVGLVSICLRKKIFDKFDERFEIIGDFDLTLKLSKNNVFGVIHEPLSYYRFHEKNFSLLNKKKHFDELTIWYNENLKKDKNVSQEIKKIFLNQLDEMRFISLALSNERIKAISFILTKFKLLKKIRFLIFLILPTNIIKKFVNR